MMLCVFKQTARQHGSMDKPAGSQVVDKAASLADFAV